MKFLVPGLLLVTAVPVLHAQAPPDQSTRVSPFKHVVIIFQENRTPDNLFQGLCTPPYGKAASCSTTPGEGQYNIQTRDWLDNKTSTGVIQPLPVRLANKYDLSHAHQAFTSMCDIDPATERCKMDGASAIGCGGTCLTQPQFRYVSNANGVLNPYLELATQYAWGNYMFQTNQGPSFPAHQFMFGGTSAPSAPDDAAGIFAAENMSNTGIGGLSATAGCIAQADTRVQLVGPSGVENPADKIYPCFEHKTLPDVLPPDLTWRYYTPGAGSIWSAPDAIQHICQSTGPGGKCVGPAWDKNVDLKPADVLTDISHCDLRSVTWVIPSGKNSDHAKSNDGGGPSWVASIVNAIGQSSTCDGGAGYWKDTAIFITWDDWGGWYDHVPPAKLPYPQGGYQYGFRVPLIVVSAYTPRHYINNVQHDFGSILRFVEFNAGVPEGSLHFADARATSDLTGFFDTSLPPRPFSPIAAPLPASFFIQDKRPATDPDDD